MPKTGRERGRWSLTCTQRVNRDTQTDPHSSTFSLALTKAVTHNEAKGGRETISSAQRGVSSRERR